MYPNVCELLKMTIIAPIFGTLTRFFYNLGYICTLLELPFHSESISVIFNFEHLSSQKL